MGPADPFVRRLAGDGEHGGAARRARGVGEPDRFHLLFGARPVPTPRAHDVNAVTARPGLAEYGVDRGLRIEGAVVVDHRALRGGDAGRDARLDDDGSARTAALAA